MSAAMATPKFAYKDRSENDENDAPPALHSCPHPVGTQTPNTQRLLRTPHHVVASPKTQLRHKQKVDLLHKLQRQNSFFRRELNKVGAPAACEGALEASESMRMAQTLKASIEIWHSHSEQLHRDEPLSVDALAISDREAELSKLPDVEGTTNDTATRAEVDLLRAQLESYMKRLAELERTSAQQLEAMQRRCDSVEAEAKAMLEQERAAVDEYRGNLARRNADYQILETDYRDLRQRVDQNVVSRRSVFFFNGYLRPSLTFPIAARASSLLSSGSLCPSLLRGISSDNFLWISSATPIDRLRHLPPVRLSLLQKTKCGMGHSI